MFEPRQTGNNRWAAAIPDGKGGYRRTLRMVFFTYAGCLDFCNKRNKA